jgi:hypothetical protein
MNSESHDRRTEFAGWMSSAFNGAALDTVRAFSFNIAETHDAFVMELIGAPEYDADDPDWACDEVFAYRDPPFQLLPKKKRHTWENALDFAAGLVRRFIEERSANAMVLASRTVAVGFVDGDLQVVWPQPVQGP